MKLFKLPVSGFRFLTETEKEFFDVMNIPDDGEDGYIIECDLAYPPKLHEIHDDYPLAPERKNVCEDNLSEYQLNLLNRLEIKYNDNQLKLIPNLSNKTNYITHYRYF